MTLKVSKKVHSGFIGSKNNTSGTANLNGAGDADVTAMLILCESLTH